MLMWRSAHCGATMETLKTILDLLAVFSTYAGFSATAILCWLLRGSADGLQRYFLWLLGMWAWLSLVEIATALQIITPEWSSLARKSIGRPLLLCGLVSFLWEILRHRPLKQ